MQARVCVLWVSRAEGGREAGGRPSPDSLHTEPARQPALLGMGRGLPGRAEACSHSGGGGARRHPLPRATCGSHGRVWLIEV